MFRGHPRVHLLNQLGEYSYIENTGLFDSVSGLQFIKDLYVEVSRQLSKPVPVGDPDLEELLDE